MLKRAIPGLVLNCSDISSGHRNHLIVPRSNYRGTLSPFLTVLYAEVSDFRAGPLLFRQSNSRNRLIVPQSTYRGMLSPIL